VVRIIWELSAFDAETGELVGIWPLHGIAPAELKTLFGLKPDEEMIGEYEISEEQAPRLQQVVEHRIDLVAHVYFVGATDADWH
jgi:hypothetical protein